LGGGAYPAVGIPHCSVGASWLRNQLCCICTKIGESERSSTVSMTGTDGTGGMAASAAPQPPLSTGAGAGAGVGCIGAGFGMTGTDGADRGGCGDTGAIGDGDTGGAGVAKPFIGAAEVAVTG
jgi:hypothetical protein